MPALILLARRIQQFLSLVNREVEYYVPGTNDLVVLHLSGILYTEYLFYIFFCEEKSQLPGFELTPRHVRRFRGYQLNHRGDRME